MIYILLGYMWLAVHRPFEIWPVLGTIRLERVYMVFTLVAYCLSRKTFPSNIMHLAYLFFSTVLLASWMASPWPSECSVQLEAFFKVFVVYVLLTTTIKSEADLKLVIRGFLFVMFLYLAHSLREFRAGKHVYRMGIIRLVGVDQSGGDPNSFAATIIYALPLLYPLWMETSSWRSRLRWALAGYFTLSVGCVVLTGSRGGFVGLLICLLSVIRKSKYRWRMLLAALVVSPVVWFAMGERLQNRFWTIIDPSVGPANAQESTEGRTRGLLDGIKLFQRYPVLGCGPGAWLPATGSELRAHNVYGQVMGELGGLGVAAFLGIIGSYIINLAGINAAYKRHPEWGTDFCRNLSTSIGISLVLLLVMGLVGHNLFRYTWVWYAGFLVSARQVVRQRDRADGIGWEQTVDGRHPGLRASFPYQPFG